MQTDLENVQREVSPVPIWRCRDRSCKAWVREEMASSASPECPLCRGAMIRSIKHLPKLQKKYAAPKKVH